MATAKPFIIITYLFLFGIIRIPDSAGHKKQPLIRKINFDNPCPGRASGFPGYYFIQVMQMLLESHCALGDPDDYPRNSAADVRNNDEFDFIIVGGGSAGSVIANRLTEVSKWKILLIEAGGNPTFESDIPGFSLSLPGGTLDWNFPITKSKDACLGMENDSCVISQGKVLGGTSTINRMHYLRGNRADYEEWERLGNREWSYESVLPYFKKSEKLEANFKVIGEPHYEDELIEWKGLRSNDDDWKFHLRGKFAIGKYHSKSGTMGVDHFAYDSSLSRLKRKLCEAAEQSGIPLAADVHGKSQIGCAEILAVSHERNRGNIAKVFLGPVKGRKNLMVATNATVQRLITEGNSVKGVKYSYNGKIISVYARKEVIVSAGAINSPRLLMLSGIGYRKRLESVKVEVAHDLPGVGENLQMQISFFGLPFVLNPEKFQTPNMMQKMDAMYYFLSRGEGMFGNVALNDVVTFLSTTNETVPDIQLLHYFSPVKDYYSLNELLISLKVKNELSDLFVAAHAKSNILLIMPTLLRPKITGRVELKAPHSEILPKITFDFLRNREDVEMLIRGIDRVIEIMESEALKEFQPDLIDLNLNECRSLRFKSNDYWECAIRHMTTVTHEASGTCKMGPRDDPEAVVDEELKVHGLKGLRVADSSVMPTMIRGSTSVASVMIGEKVSDMIKSDWMKSKRDEL